MEKSSAAGLIIEGADGAKQEPCIIGEFTDTLMPGRGEEREHGSEKRGGERE